MPLNLFRKKKQPEQEKPALPPQDETQQEPAISAQELIQEPTIATQEPAQETSALIQEQPQENVESQTEKKQDPNEIQNKTYLKAMPLRELTDLENIKTEVKNGNIIILRVTPLASKSIEDVKNAVNELYQFAESVGGDIARLGEERVVICPKSIRIWREKSPAPVPSETLPTAA